MARLCKYRGKVFTDINTVYTPELQDKYAYALIYGSGDDWGLLMTSSPYKKNGLKILSVSSGEGYGAKFDFETKTWIMSGTLVSFGSGATLVNGYACSWTNYNVYDQYGSLHLAPTEPEPLIPDIIIRCPDSVRQGLFIIVACDCSYYEYKQYLSEYFFSYVDFTCTLSGHTSDKTFLMQNTDKSLRLQCGSDEGASELLLTVEVDGETVSKAITVIPYTPVGPGSGDNEYDTTSSVTDISLLAFPDTVAPGGYSIMLISVNGEGNYSQRITAEISGHTSADTQYFSDGYFCNIAVGKDETAESILVTITSAQDPTVSASVTVNVDHSGDTPIDPGTDEERLQRAFWKGFAAGIPG